MSQLSTSKVFLSKIIYFQLYHWYYLHSLWSGWLQLLGFYKFDTFVRIDRCSRQRNTLQRDNTEQPILAWQNHTWFTYLWFWRYYLLREEKSQTTGFVRGNVCYTVSHIIHYTNSKYALTFHVGFWAVIWRLISFIQLLYSLLPTHPHMSWHRHSRSHADHISSNDFHATVTVRFWKVWQPAQPQIAISKCDSEASLWRVMSKIPVWNRPDCKHDCLNRDYHSQRKPIIHFECHLFL